MRSITIAITAILTLGLVGAAQAALISHSTLGVLGEDNFEAQPLGAIPNGSGLPNPVNAGENGWDPFGEGAGAGTVVTTGTGPGPIEGSRFVSMFNNGLAGAGNNYRQRLDTVDVPQATGGDITASFSFYVDSSPTPQAGAFGFEFKSLDTGGFTMLNAGFSKTGDINVNGTARTFPVNQWNAMRFTYHNVPGGGNDTIDFEILSTAGSPISSASGIAASGDDGTRDVSMINFFADNYSLSYIDAFVIPEPSTVAIFGLGALLLAGLRKRARE